MKLVIVESPAKAKTINKYLGKDFKVIASFGHVRDIPSKNGSVLPDENFAMKYEITPTAVKSIKAICDSAKESTEIFLATDPDREGEAISWHIAEVLREKRILKKNMKLHRVTFNEITKKAVLDAIAQPMVINNDLVDAQQARRALDYLVGFNLSPVLWRKLPGSRSAGRVQSVALRLICEREAEIESFITTEYWSITAKCLTEKNENFIAKLSAIDNKKLDKLAINNADQANEIVNNIKKYQYTVTNIEKKQQSRNPQPPFITSSLQQEAARKLGFSAKKTMQYAQKLYEGIEVNGETVGLITYMRTDSVALSKDAVTALRELILKEFGKDYLPTQARIYKTKSKNAQEAHEAIRPTDMNYSPNYLASFLDKDQLKLYDLIWKRTLACQMENALIDIVTVTIDSQKKEFTFRASGSSLRFDGFYRLYREGKDDEEEEDDNKLLPFLENKDQLKLSNITPNQHFTEPAPRYSESSLVKKLEELSIGRPSTYASIISVIQERQYVKFDKKRFEPEERGRLVTAFLSSFFPQYVQYEFTANLEHELDEIAAGRLQWQAFLQKFWVAFNNNIAEVSKLRITEVIDLLNEVLADHLFPKRDDDTDPRSCPTCETGQLSLKLGKFGAFVACSSYPECKYNRQIDQNEQAENTMISQESENEILGIHPLTLEAVYLKKGPYGWYIQLGENPVTKDTKPKRSPLPPGYDYKDIKLDFAIQLLSLPKILGTHPESGDEISVNIGKFGPYVKHGSKFTSVPKDEDIFTINLDRAISIIKNYKK